MADFKEEMYVRQLDAETYSYCWCQYDLTLDLVDNPIDTDYLMECTAEELYDALERHSCNIDKVFDHFEDYPMSSIMLSEEY